MYFIFNGVNSKDLGLKVKNLPFNIMPKRRFTSITNNKRNGTIYTDEETYESYTLDIECLLIDTLTSDTINMIKTVFKGGKGVLTLSTDLTRSYDVYLNSALSFVEMLDLTGSCLLSFTVEPLANLESGTTKVVVSNGSKLKNVGNMPSNPKIYVTHSSSSVTISINGESMKFSGVTEPFIIDVELEDVYSESGANLNKFMSLDSDFIGLSEGDNTITFSGASKVEIVPRWRSV